MNIFDRLTADRLTSMRILTTALALVRDDLSEVGRSALSEAESYWLKGGHGGLLASRVACWRYLDAKNGNSSTIADREDFATRALICVLYEDEDSNDIGDSMSFTLEMFRGLQLSEAELLAIADVVDPRGDAERP